jgi:hypothetical protein
MRIPMLFATVLVLAGCPAHETGPGPVGPGPGEPMDAGTSAPDGAAVETAEPVTTPEPGEDPSATGRCDAAGWCREGDPATQSALRSIAGVPGGPVWAVGEYGAIVRRGPAGWMLEASGTTERLEDLWVGSADDAIAVGYNGTIVEWNGAAWRVAEHLTDSILNAVWGFAGGEAWAVGDNGGESVVLRRRDGLWRDVTPRRWRSGRWFDIAGSASDDVWATAGEGEVLHWDGTTWEKQPGPGGSVYAVLWVGGPQDVWVSGCNYPGSICESFLAHWDGLAWTVGAEGGPVRGTLAGWMTPAGDLWLVADWGLARRTPDGAVHEETENVYLGLADVWASAEDGVFAVGGSGGILHHAP